MFRKDKTLTPEDLLKDIEALNGNSDVKDVLRRFILNNLLDTNGIIIIFLQGKHVNIDGTKFSEPESVWALEKAKHKIMEKGISFND
jgi:hypothetical protein